MTATTKPYAGSTRTGMRGLGALTRTEGRLFLRDFGSLFFAGRPDLSPTGAWVTSSSDEEDSVDEIAQAPTDAELDTEPTIDAAQDG